LASNDYSAMQDSVLIEQALRWLLTGTLCLPAGLKSRTNLNLPYIENRTLAHNAPLKIASI